MSRIITADCVVCETTFTYEYRGGRYRRFCSDDCDRAKGAIDKRRERNAERPRERPDGTVYVPDEYPVTVSAPPRDLDWQAGRERSRARRERARLRAEPEGTTVDRRYSDPTDDQDESVPESPETGIRDLVRAGHGFGMDDQRAHDQDALRYVPARRREAVREWFRNPPNADLPAPPLAGLAGVPHRPGDRQTPVIGSDRPYVDTYRKPEYQRGTETPRPSMSWQDHRVTEIGRAWPWDDIVEWSGFGCSRSPLAHLAPFVSISEPALLAA
ncbi:hypothetical protein ACL02T_08540 [Pseudonocardia sp. RS010]|uniref:hypothetical protein n=1 Tax=Pseudonocardia sp. RS010 TaxID=3385979 RepID=UPI0039A26E73